MSTLLHELDHYVQHLDRDWPCWRRTERQACELQQAWLAERGIDAGIDWLYVAAISSCRLWGWNEAIPRRRPVPAD